MIKNTKWTFFSKNGREALPIEQIHTLRTEISRTIKVGIEFEYNLKEPKDKCTGNNPDCTCCNIHQVGGGHRCVDVCSMHGKCTAEKESGCPSREILCPFFELPCSTCDKFNLGCSDCDRFYNKNKTPKTIRKAISDELQPTMFLGSLGKHGVLDVVKDGSLTRDGGVEVVTVGRRVSFNEIYDMSKSIMDSVSKHGAFVDERTSVHYHLLTGYLSASKYNESRPDYGLTRDRSTAFPSGAYDSTGNLVLKDFEQAVPEIVLANFHQLYRRYENAIIWMTSTGDKIETLTRWVKFRRPMIKFSAVREPMSSLRKSISEGTDKARYAAVNYLPVSFDANGNIDRLHFEVRVCDGLMSPSAAAAFACLFYGLLIKAIDISRHGLVESGDKEYMSTEKQILESLCNNNGDYGNKRISSTARAQPFFQTLISQSKELVNFIKPTILREHPSFDILMSLAERPISLRRCDGQSWERIEYDLSPDRGSSRSVAEMDVMRVADVGAVSDCDSMEEWVAETSDDLGHKKEVVLAAVEKLISKGLVNWDNRVGSLISR